MPRKWKYLIPSFRRREEREMQAELAALAEIAGKRELGNLTLAAEGARSEWGWTGLDSVVADVRYALRTLRRKPSFALVAVISLSLGIGANAAIFSLMDALLWRGLPVREPEQLVTFVNSSHSYFGYSRFAAESAGVMESVAAVSTSYRRRFDRGGGTERGTVQFASGNFFSTLGVQMASGRPIAAEDDRRADPAAVAVLSHAYWQKAYGGGAVLGRTIRVEQAVFTIIGVAPAEFFGLSVGEVPDLWLPVTAVDGLRVFRGASWLDSKNNNFLTIVGRMKPGISLQQAAAALTPLSIQIDIDRNGMPANEKERRALFESKLILDPAGKGLSFLRDRFSKPLRVVFWMVAIGLLMGCVNVMSLEFARADERRKELTVRLAIGASRWRVARQLLTESLVVAIASGLIGMALRRPLAQALVGMITVWGDQPAQLVLDNRPGILLFIAGVSILAALVSGVLPAMRATRGEMLTGLQQASRGTNAGPVRQFAGRMVASTQMALSLVLVAAACLFAYSLHQLHQFDSGLNRNRLVVLDLDPADAGYKDAALIAVNQRLREQLAGVPGVEAVSFSQNGIYSGRNYDTMYRAEGSAYTQQRARSSTYDHVGPYFFTTAGTRVLAGRDFNERDDAAAPKVAIVTREFARRVFQGNSAVDRNLYIATAKDTWVNCQIVGVVQDIRRDVRRPQPMFYLPQLQSQVQAFSTRFLVRTRLDPQAVIPGLRAAVRAENPALHIDQIDSAEELLDRTLSTDRLMAALAWGFGVLAIILAAVGIYGLLSFEVTRRTAEIGIRMAIGARRGDVVSLVIREVAIICVAGLTVGSIAAFAMARLVESLVFQMKPGNPMLEGAAAVLLTAAAMLAAWLPARRAARMDPMMALRSE